MQGKTHKAGGVLATFITFEVLRSKGLLLPETNEYLQLLVMYPFAIWGSVAADLDHGMQSIPARDPISIGIHKLLRIMGAKHRSWQTHCLLITLGFTLFIMSIFKFLEVRYYSSGLDLTVMRLIFYGATIGLVSHLFLDMITPSGVHIVPNVKFSLVPNTRFFSTGNTWEQIIHTIIMFSNFIFIAIIFLRFFNIDIVMILQNYIGRI